MTKIDSTVVKKSISLSKVVSQWADELAEKKGFGTNYSAYIADLIRRDKERNDDLQFSSLRKQKAASAIVETIQEAAQKKSSRLKRD